MFRLVIIFFIFLIGSQLQAQKHMDSYDSLALAFLRQNNNFNDSIGLVKYHSRGQETTGKNYYCYKSFNLQINDSENIVVINFGRYDSESKSYMAVINQINKEQKVLFLGKENYTDDLDKLNTFFKNKSEYIKEKYKIEITDLFLRCRQGQIETPKYIY